MKLKFYNTLTRKKEEFIPVESGKAKIYSCGPTVYDYAHIGNFRSYIFSDLLRRVLKYNGYKVIHVMNITDVDDKTIARANERGMSLKEYTEIYTKAFFEDLETLRIERVEYYPRATEHIKEMHELIKKLEEKGYTYISEGSVYYKISKFKEYGKLSHLDLSGIKEGARVDADEYTKENVRDFVLWKARKEGEPYWDSPWGPGRPGWHIECSAMSMKYLGETFDIHTGGIDLIFPHHENEIAQSEGATGKPFVKYWLHCAHLIVEGEKMSKSKGNFFTLRDLLNKGFSPLAIRYLLLSTHYRSQLNFTFEGLKSAGGAVERLQNFYDTIRWLQPVDRNTNNNIISLIEDSLKDFEKYLADDLNISPALASVFELIHEINKFLLKEKLNKEEKERLIDFIKKVNRVIDVVDIKEEELPEEILRKIKEREEARKRKDFALADKIRDELKEMGIILEDTREGTRWRKIKK